MSASKCQNPKSRAETIGGTNQQGDLPFHQAALDLDRSGLPASVTIELVAAVKPTGQESLSIKAIYPG